MSGAGLVGTYDLRRDGVRRKIVIEAERSEDRSLPLIHVAEGSGGCGLVFATSMNDGNFSDYLDLLHQVVALDEQGKAGTRHLEKIISEKNRVFYEGEVYTKKDVDNLQLPLNSE